MTGGRYAIFCGGVGILVAVFLILGTSFFVSSRALDIPRSEGAKDVSSISESTLSESDQMPVSPASYPEFTQHLIDGRLFDGKFKSELEYLLENNFGKQESADLPSRQKPPRRDN